ncbi:MAG: hypothetical protein PUC65_05670 [Clostridiales bacterium]|nr:hypothetical protein [Clostridiales bacterium]
MKHFINNQSTEQQNAMDLQLIRISKYHSINISKNVGSIMLILFIVTAILINRDSIPAFYILAANNFLPFLFIPIFQHNASNHKGMVLPLLSKKYNYTYIKYQCSSLSYFFVFLLLFLWQRRELNNLDSFQLLSFTPVAILFIMFMIRVLGNVYFRRKLHQSLMDSNF